MALGLDSVRRPKRVQVVKTDMFKGGRVSHTADIPIAHVYRGRTMFLKFEWNRPNDEVPSSAKIIEPAPIDGLGEVAAELTGPWPDYPAALSEAMAAAERWVDSQLP